MIGILTLHNATNYGAVLQSYALQKKLDELKLDNEVVNYQCPKIENQHKVRFKLKNPLGYFIKKRTRKSFDKFRKEKMRVSREYASMSTDMPYTAYITGSDQIWNLNITGEDDTYFLDFADSAVKRYSYAASIGPYRFDKGDTAKRYAQLLSEYEGISVREQSAKSYLVNLQKETGVQIAQDINVHIDPVLLLTRQDWQKVMVKKNIKKPYILLYTIGFVPELIKKARELSKQSGYPVYWLSDSLRYIKGIRHVRSSSPAEFVGMFEESACVVTNSFHGTAFSILFHKNFYAMDMQNGRKKERIADLLAWTGLSASTVENMGKDIYRDWKNTEVRLEQERLKAAEYLCRL